MATITHLGDFYDRTGTYSRRVGLYTGPASYTTGGDSLTPEQVSLGKIEHADFAPAWQAGNIAASAPYTLIYDRTNKKVVWVVSTTGAELANGTNVSAFTSDFEIVGK